MLSVPNLSGKRFVLLLQVFFRFLGRCLRYSVSVAIKLVRLRRYCLPGVRQQPENAACTLILRSKVQPLAAAQAAGGPDGKTGTELGGAFALQSDDRRELTAESAVSAVLVLQVARLGWRRKSYGCSTYIAFEWTELLK